MRRGGYFTLDGWLLLAWLLPFALHLSTLAPSVTFYDSGEFITAVYGLGSAHSPGYPLFLLFAKPFTWLPIGSVAFRVNLATACSTALACVGVFLLVRRLLAELTIPNAETLHALARNAAALCGSLLFAASPRLWLQANHDKPYPLLAFMVALTFLFLLRWRSALQAGEEQPAWWYATGFVAGLATGAHQTIILLVPAWTLFVLLSRPRMLLRLRELLLTLACALAGAAVQLYLPLRAAAVPLQNWGDPSSLSRFLWHVLRRGYPEQPPVRDLPLLLKQLAGFSIPHEFGWLGLVLLLVGLLTCWQVQRPFAVAAVATLLSFWGVIVGVFNPQPDSIFLTEAFYTPLYLLAAALIAVGLYTVLRRGIAAAELPGRLRVWHRGLVVVFLLLVPAFQVAAQYRANAQQRNYLAHDYATSTLRALPEQAVLFTWGDSGAFPLWYLQSVERLREDIDLLHIPHLVFAWYRREVPRLQPVFAGITLDGKSAEQLFFELAPELQLQRPVAVDYSTRHSVAWGKREPLPAGMVFLWPSRDVHISLGDETSLWDQMVLHRFSEVPGWQIDEDSRKAVMIVAYALMQAAESTVRAGQPERAAGMLNEVQRMLPAWQESVEQLRRRYQLPGPGGGQE